MGIIVGVFTAMPLTELAIKNLKPKAKPYRVADSGGLCLKVTPTGGKFWVWRYRFLGKEQTLALGKYPIISLAKARKLRDEARELAQEGKQLTREKKAKKLRQAYESDNTFRKVALDWHETRKGSLNEKYYKQCLSRLEQLVFPTIGSLPIVDITIPDVVQLVEKIGKRGESKKTGKKGTIDTAKRIKQYIAQIFRYAAQKGLCIHNPAADLRAILPKKDKKHHACIPLFELPELLQAIDNRNEAFAKAAMQLLALTFVRTSELIGARWIEIDWERQEWHIPKERMKMKRPHVVPLSIQSIAVLKKLQAETGKMPFVFFSGASKSKHISNGTVLMALRRMGYEKRMTGHGFRTLASTILNEKGYPPDVIERQLAHEDADKVRSAYNRAEYLPERKKMMQDYADLLDEIKSSGKVDLFRQLKAV